MVKHKAPSRSGYGGKSRKELESYLSSIRKSSSSEDTPTIDDFLKTSPKDQVRRGSTISQGGLKGISSVEKGGDFQVSERLPYRSFGTSLSEIWERHGGKIVGGLLVIIVGAAVTTVWDINRDVGVLQGGLGEIRTTVTNIQEDYRELEGENEESSKLIVNINRDLEYIKEKILNLEKIRR